MDSPSRAALVLSDGHSLLPFAHRLVREGLQVEVAVVHAPARYQQAWAGKFKPFLEVRKGGLDPETRKALLEVAEGTDAFVLTNSRALSDSFGGYPRTFGRLASPDGGPPSTLAVGAWFDGANFVGHHLWVRDIGLWPGGAGPAALAGGTLVQVAAAVVPVLAGVLSPLGPALRSHNFRGLVSADVELGAGEVPEATGRWEAGWPHLHTHAFVSDLPSLGAVLGGAAPTFPAPFTQVVVVSVPPYPIKCNVQPTPGVEILGVDGQPLPAAVVGQTFFHDMQLAGRRVQVVGLDGLVAVCRGSGATAAEATEKALHVARAIALPERQLRTDVGVAALNLPSWGTSQSLGKS